MRPVLEPVLSSALQGTDAATRQGPGYVLVDLLAPTLDPRIAFSRSTVKTYVDAAGVLQTAPADVSPVDHDPVTHAALGRSIWDARTNLLSNSATLVTQGVTTTAQAYAVSFYGTGSVVLSGTATGTLNGTGATTRVSMIVTATAGTLTLTASGSVTNAQVEAGTTMGPYIATTTPQSRAPEIATISPLSAVGLGGEGTLYVEAILPDATNAGATINTAIGVSDNSSANNVTLTMINTGMIRLRVLAAGSVNVSQNIQVVPYGNTVKMAFTYTANAVSTCVAGGTVIHNTGVVMPVVSQVDIGRTGNTLNRSWNSVLRQVRFYPGALSDASLQALTQ